MSVHEIMTTQEVAEYLRLNEATIYKLAQAGEIPAVKIGGIWRFKRELLDEWFEKQAGLRFEDKLEESKESGKNDEANENERVERVQ